jgi:hypothetical protein
MTLAPLTRAMSIVVTDRLLRVSWCAQNARDVLEKFDANPVFGREKGSDITIADAL